MIYKLQKNLENKSLANVVFIFCAIQLVVIIFLSVVVSNVDPSLTEIDWLNDLSLFDIFLLSVIVVPLVETCIFQFFIIESTFLFIENSSWAEKIALILSSILFGLSHYYNIYYIVIMIFIGLFYCWIYIFIRNWKSRKSAFWSLTLIHATNNLFAFIVDDVLKLS
ncbi:hypothetical protein AWW67_01540 [Roseivirga seohaensis]|uniref:CAAX prenyl protease 2/Lysostaphin resistance protein A-like domain-containing protein n=1 Tax=Roseivirga seohaensis TaxID=1914963 RepID=A0A150Y1M5_9BACT|nr:hypothetical protein AWW67_01540 [Roseivirga seohaensis]